MSEKQKEKLSENKESDQKEKESDKEKEKEKEKEGEIKESDQLVTYKSKKGNKSGVVKAKPTEKVADVPKEKVDDVAKAKVDDVAKVQEGTRSKRKLELPKVDQSSKKKKDEGCKRYRSVFFSFS